MANRLAPWTEVSLATANTLQSTLGSWRDDRGRIVNPLGVSLPGSFDTVPFPIFHVSIGTALAAYLFRDRAMTSVRGLRVSTINDVPFSTVSDGEWVAGVKGPSRGYLLGM